MKKYIYYILGILVFSLGMVLISNATHANLDYVRAQYQGAVRCYKVGTEPKQMRYKHYYHSYEECDKTIGHAV